MEGVGLLPVAALYVVCWCVIHSLLLTPKASNCIKAYIGRFSGWYRFFYNLVAIITLFPLLVYLQTIQEPKLIAWSGWFILIRILLMITAVLLFYGGSRAYDFRTFMGISQIRSGKDVVLLNEDASFKQDGVLGVIRHPWYVGGILLLWSIRGQYSLSVIIIYSILTVYLVIGAFLEERRLSSVFGQEYECYRNEVSMFFPGRWLSKRLSRYWKE